ncbi:MAG: hypothetical protein RIC35_23045 [Marinoscillum sp.]
MTGFSQEFQLPELDHELLGKEYQKSGYAEDLIYIYLHTTFDSLEKKKEVIHYKYPNYSICSFNQNFQHEINYSIEQCGEAGGASVILVLPKTERRSVVNLINDLYEIDRTDIENEWNAEYTKFEPKDNGVGCYYEIIEKENATVIKNYCGC